MPPFDVPGRVGAERRRHVLPCRRPRRCAAVRRADHGAAVRARRQATIGDELVVVHRAAEPQLVRVPRHARRPAADDEVVVAALAVLAVTVSQEPVRAVGRARELRPTGVRVATARSTAIDAASFVRQTRATRMSSRGVAEIDARLAAAEVDGVELDAIAEACRPDSSSGTPATSTSRRRSSARDRSRTTAAYIAFALFGSSSSFVIPPWNQSKPDQARRRVRRGLRR